MGYADQFQTIIYDKTTGVIRKTLPSQYIQSRKSLNRILGVEESPELRFFYYKSRLPINPEKFRVQLAANLRPPRLLAMDGTDPTLEMIRLEAQLILGQYNKITFAFEGGFGDHMDQADALIALRKEHPETKLTAVLQPDRLPALRMMEGFDAIEHVNPRDHTKRRSVVLRFDNISRLSGDYPIGGKVGVYSAIAGLSCPAQRAKILLSPDSLEDARATIQEATGRQHSRLIALHTMSGKTNTKSLSPARTLELISPLLKDKNLFFLHFGGAGEELVDHPQVIPLQGKLSWEKVFHAMACCDGCICIDSAIMHIAQHLNLPTVSFWGPTMPAVILDTPPGVDTIISLAACRGCNRYDCDKDLCMKNFNREEVSRKFKKLEGKKKEAQPDG